MRGVGINKMFFVNAADTVAGKTNCIDEIGK